MTRRLIGFLVTLALAILVAPLAPAAPWDRSPTLTVAAPAHDRRIPLALEAVESWNRTSPAVAKQAKSPVSSATLRS
jgi:hypothetical protein